MDKASDRELNRMGLVTAAIASLGVALCQVNGIKKASPEWFDPVLNIRNQARIPTQVRETFLALAKENKIPSWALRHFDLKEFVGK